MPVVARFVRITARGGVGRAARLAAGASAFLLLGSLATGCADNALYPTSLEELPPKDPDAQQLTAPAEESPDGEPSPRSSDSSDGMLVPCTTIDIELPDSWKLVDHGDEFWSFSLPDRETGGGVVRVSGSFTEGAGTPGQRRLESLVRGKEGEDAAVQIGDDGAMIGRVDVKRGNEWRVAKGFKGEGIQVATVSYAPAGDASDDEVEATRALLQDAVAKLEIRNVGNC